MLGDLKFLTAAVAKKDFVEELCHIHVHDFHGYAFDGVTSMHTKLNIEFTVRPHASSFIKAIAACDDEGAIAMHETPTGLLSIKSGKFRAFVKCLEKYKQGINIPKPEGENVIITDELFASIKELAPFMSIDASRPWAQGLRIVGNSTYATNNIILVERWHGSEFPFEIIVPAEFVRSVIRINQKPTGAQVTASSLTFHYPDERWIRTQLVVGGWPTNLEKIFRTNKGVPLPEGFFRALDKLKPFMDDRGRVWVFNDRVTTSNIEGEGAMIEIETELDGVLFHLEQLKLLEPVVQTIDLKSYPEPCAWYGNHMRGVIVGLKA